MEAHRTHEEELTKENALSIDITTDGPNLIPDACPDCGEPAYDAGCEAPGCSGRGCQCGWGCDYDFVDDGQCRTAADEEGEEEHADRVDAERDAAGLPRL